MEIEVVLPVPFPSSPEFSFDSSTSTPYITAPSSPQRFGAANPFYTSPAPATAVDLSRTSFSINPSLWEEDNPCVSGNGPRSPSDFIHFDDFEFEFDGSCSSRFESSPALADDLFDGGRIKPLRMMAAPLDQNSKTEPPTPSSTAAPTKRVCDILTEEDEDDEYEEEEEEERSNTPEASVESAAPSSSRTFSSLLPSITIPKGYRKWSFRDFLLFRSASEGRGTGNKDLLRKFPILGQKIGRSNSLGESTRGSSFRAAAAPAREESTSGRTGQRSIGAHEAYYTANRAVAEEMKRRTVLPYKQGLLGGCLGFNPNSGTHDLARRGFGPS